ncbi:MAG: serine/threonine-protein phosphatase, partial [Pirellulaceae bacterium]|nr:serine/threonine-protein phosphatase [Pirellulaceae bacterium]
MVDRRTLAVVMADVSGKGIPAAIYMAVTRTTLRLFASPDKTPARVVAEVNRSLASENNNEMFVTLFLAYYDIESGELTYANAGHVPPYVLREGGRLDSLEPTGPLVAPFADAVFEDARCRLEPGDQLILYTDGVTEAMSADGKFYGEERFKAFLHLRDEDRQDDVCQGILDEIREFSRGELSDDATLLVLRRTGRVAPILDGSTTGAVSNSLGVREDPEIWDVTLEPETPPR